MKIVVLMEDTCGHPACQYEHGLSVYIETERHRLLADTGKTDAFIRNAKMLGIDLARTDTVILSHGHYDHAGGIPAFWAVSPEAEIYMQRSACGDFYHKERYIGIDKRIAGMDHVTMLDGDYRIDGELFLFTNITGRKYFARSNLQLTEKIQGKTVQDRFAHEQCLVITQGNKQILVSGCAHNGILNILARHRELFERDPDIVISGFHMMKKGAYTDEEKDMIIRTAEELGKMNTVFYTGHCTGEEAFALMAPRMGDKLVRIQSGTQIL